MKVIV